MEIQKEDFKEGVLNWLTKLDMQYGVLTSKIDKIK